MGLFKNQYFKMSNGIEIPKPRARMPSFIHFLIINII
jgi:hypothetical protein